MYAAPMATPLRRALSLAVGWLADRRLPRPLRGPLFRAYARLYSLDLDEVLLPLEEHPSLTAFFIRRLKPGSRPLDGAPEALLSPADGRILSAGPLSATDSVSAKGRTFSLSELTGGLSDSLAGDGGTAWIVYLSPRDYHRVHAPIDCRLTEIRWLPGARRSVAPAVVARRPVLAENERCALRLETDCGPLFMVLVGALNVGRLRVIGQEKGRSGPLASARTFARGEEVGRFELGSTVVLFAPAGGPTAIPCETGQPILQGERIGTFPTLPTEPAP